jgi:hypothetical protein
MMTDAFASADASAKKSLCADKPDLSTMPGRMAFAEKVAEIRLAGLKAIEPKLQAFYDTPWTRGRRERSTLAGATAAYSVGGARHKGPPPLNNKAGFQFFDGPGRRKASSSAPPIPGSPAPVSAPTVSAPVAGCVGI